MYKELEPIQKQQRGLCSKKDYIVSYTSGSTGEPFSFLLDKNQ